jgi:hypothetical protein
VGGGGGAVNRSLGRELLLTCLSLQERDFHSLLLLFLDQKFSHFKNFISFINGQF